MYTNKLEGTPACTLRDGLNNARHQNKKTLKQIEDRIFQVGIPEILWPDILNMVHYRQYDRTTDPVELILERYVHVQLIHRIVISNQAA